MNINLPAKINIQQIDNGWLLIWDSGADKNIDLDPPAATEYHKTFESLRNRINDVFCGVK